MARGKEQRHHSTNPTSSKRADDQIFSFGSKQASLSGSVQGMISQPQHVIIRTSAHPLQTHGSQTPATTQYTFYRTKEEEKEYRDQVRRRQNKQLIAKLPQKHRSGGGQKNQWEKE